MCYNVGVWCGGEDQKKLKILDYFFLVTLETKIYKIY